MTGVQSDPHPRRASRWNRIDDGLRCSIQDDICTRRHLSSSQRQPLFHSPCSQDSDTHTVIISLFPGNSVRIDLLNPIDVFILLGMTSSQLIKCIIRLSQRNWITVICLQMRIDSCRFRQKMAILILIRIISSNLSTSWEETITYLFEKFFWATYSSPFRRTWKIRNNLQSALFSCTINW